MFSDLLARLFVTAFFITYGVVMIFLLKWIIRTWPGAGRRHSPGKASAPIGDADCEEGSACD